MITCAIHGDITDTTAAVHMTSCPFCLLDSVYAPHRKAGISTMKNYPPKEWVPNLQGRETPESMSELSGTSLRKLIAEIERELLADEGTDIRFRIPLATEQLLRKILEMLKLEDR